MLHFQGDNSFMYLENMTLAHVNVFCIHNLRHYSAKVPTMVFPATCLEVRENKPFNIRMYGQKDKICCMKAIWKGNIAVRDAIIPFQNYEMK